MEKMDIVDKNNRPIGTCFKNEVYKFGYSHRISHVLIFDNEGRLALQKRADGVPFCPGCWVTSAGGHVRAGETYSSAAIRELDEELGLCSPLDFVFYLEYPFGQATKFLAVFTSISNNIGKFEPGFVSDVVYFKADEIAEMIKINKNIHPELAFIFKTIFLLER